MVCGSAYHAAIPEVEHIEPATKMVFFGKLVGVLDGQEYTDPALMWIHLNVVKQRVAHAER